MEEVAKETDSEFFNKVSWQIVNTKGQVEILRNHLILLLMN